MLQWDLEQHSFHKDDKGSESSGADFDQGCGIARSISVSDKLTKVRGARVFTAGDDVGAGDKLAGAMEM